MGPTPAKPAIPPEEDKVAQVMKIIQNLEAQKLQASTTPAPAAAHEPQEAVHEPQEAVQVEEISVHATDTVQPGIDFVFLELEIFFKSVLNITSFKDLLLFSNQNSLILCPCNAY